MKVPPTFTIRDENNSKSPPENDSKRRPRWFAFWPIDAAVAGGLLLMLTAVFLIDQRSAGKPDGPSRSANSSHTIFDPLLRPIAEVREHAERDQWIGVFGGSERSEAAVRRGLDWLARHQAEDGHWGPDCLRTAPAGRCKQDACTDQGSEHSIAQTGLAVLAFQAGGHYDFNGNEYSERVKTGLDWLVKRQREDGCFIDSDRGEKQCNMYEHGIAAFALSDACEMAASSEREPLDSYRLAAQKAIRFIEYAQHNDGGWRYTPDRKLPSDTSVSGWQLLAMKAAKRGKIAEVGPDCVQKVEDFFARCEIRDSGRTGYMPGNHLSDATTGVGMLVHEFILDTPDSALVEQGAKYLADTAEKTWKNPQVKRRRFAASGADFYTWYNCTLAMFQAGGEPWRRWNDVVRDYIIDRQRTDPDACARGSWDALGEWAPEGGRIYTTSLAVLTLEVYYRYKSEKARVYLDQVRKD